MLLFIVCAINVKVRFAKAASVLQHFKPLALCSFSDYAVDGCRGNKLGCKHACEQRPHGPVCACPAGERLWRDGKTCVAADRCATPAGLCHHGCRIEDDGFPTCTCRVGHVIAADGLSCESKYMYTQCVWIRHTYVIVRNRTQSHLDQTSKLVSPSCRLVHQSGSSF